MKNKLNDLEPKEWLKFQKSWFIHNPPPRGKKVLHPATFPEGLVKEFISFFTKKGQVVFDPMCGTGSTLVAATQLKRVSIGVELSEKYYEIAVEQLRALEKDVNSVSWIVNADIRNWLSVNEDEIADYVITSPPYWDMLRRKGFEGQQKRREAGLDVHYSDDEQDLGNIASYDEFLAELVSIYTEMYKIVKPKAYVTIIVKNIKKGGRIYPLAWDLARYLSTVYALKDEKIWLADNQKLAPYGMGSAWVSNTMHTYCLQFRKE